MWRCAFSWNLGKMSCFLFFLFFVCIVVRHSFTKISRFVGISWAQKIKIFSFFPSKAFLTREVAMTYPLFSIMFECAQLLSFCDKNCQMEVDFCKKISSRKYFYLTSLLKNPSRWVPLTNFFFKVFFRLRFFFFRNKKNLSKNNFCSVFYVL